MLHITLDDANDIVILEPTPPVTEDDVNAVSRVIDEHIMKDNCLTGILVKAKDLPSWSSLSAMMAHVRFLQNHHDKILCIAIVSNSFMAVMLETLTHHFCSADIKLFKHDDEALARAWIQTKLVM